MPPSEAVQSSSDRFNPLLEASPVIPPLMDGAPVSEGIGRLVREFGVPVPIATLPGAATYESHISYSCSFVQRWWLLKIERPPVTFAVAGNFAILTSPVRLAYLKPKQFAFSAKSSPAAHQQDARRGACLSVLVCNEEIGA